MLSDPEQDGGGPAASVTLPAMPTLAPVRHRPESDPGTGSADGTGRGGRTRRWSRWVIRPILIYLASRLVTTATLAVTGWVTHRSIPAEVDRWDSVWFLNAAAHGWPTQIPYHHGYAAGSTIAFLPVFPLTIRWLSAVTGMSLLASGMVISEVTGLTAIIGVWRLVRHYADQGAADRATLMVAVFPGTFVFSLVYSEGLFVTFIAFGLLALLQRRWFLAGVLGLLATGTEPVALAFEVSCLWCAYRAISADRDWRALVPPVLTPVGFVAFQLWLWRHTGDLNAWRLTERDGWQSYPSLLYPIHTVATFVRDPVAVTKTEDLLFVGTVVTVVAAVIALRSRMPKPVLIYGLFAAALGLISAPIGMRPRFILLAFPLVAAVGTRLRGRVYVTVVTVSVVLLAAAMAYSVCSYAVFP
jgi:hypothetical protein